MNNYFKLFACCITVVGAERSIICDIQRGSFEFIPNDFLEILISYKNDNFEDITKIFWFPGTFIWKEPFFSEAVATFVPFTVIVASDTGRFVFPSIIFPTTVF